MPGQCHLMDKSGVGAGEPSRHPHRLGASVGSLELPRVTRDRLRIDQAGMRTIRVGPLGDSNLIARQLASAEFIVCASPAYLERAGRPQTLAYLRSKPSSIRFTKRSETAMSKFTS